MFLTTSNNSLGLLTYIIITASIFVFWILLWRWHKSTKAQIELNRKNLYRRWDDENKEMDKGLNKSELDAIEETTIIK